MTVHSLLDDALIAAMDEVGEAFAKGTIFVPEMLMAARAMKAGLEILRPILSQSGEPPKGLVMLATVQGDVHDIGKNLVGMMLEGAGYEVVDLGVNVTPDEVLERANELAPNVVGLPPGSDSQSVRGHRLAQVGAPSGTPVLQPVILQQKHIRTGALDM